MRAHYEMPLDPDCEVAKDYLSSLWDDPMTAYSGVGDEIQESFEKEHRVSCERCQEYGAANVEAVLG